MEYHVVVEKLCKCAIRKGMPQIKTFDDKENAYSAAKKKANLLSKEGYDNFRCKMSSFLMRRGFNYGVTKQTVDRLWRELS